MDNKALFDFLKKLKKNNHKDWFDANKKTYDGIRKEFLTFTDNILDGIRKFDPEIGDLEAKQCVFRINRDVRFSKDKSPYKTNFGASMNPGGKNSFHAGYYMHFEPGNSFIAGGMYMPDPANLARVRQEIDYNLEDFKKILAAKSFKQYFGKLGGEQLSRPPKGYEADNPAIEFLKHKSFLAWHKVDDSAVMSASYDQYVLKVFKSMYPLIQFLNQGK